MVTHPFENLPLALSTYWFLTDPPTFPYPELRAHAPIVAATYAWEYSGRLDPHSTHPTLYPHTLSKDSVLTGIVQWELDMSISKIRVRWNSANVEATLNAEVKHIPASNSAATSSPTPLELHEASLLYNPLILSFARSCLGTTVADGECWSLASAALQSARTAALRAGHSPPMPSIGRVHGEIILDWDAASLVPAQGVLEAADVRPGDIIELSNAHFRHQRVLLGGLVSSEESVRVIEHTAIVDNVKGGCMEVLEQNASMGKVVSEGRYELGKMVQGRLKVYRPVKEVALSVLNLRDTLDVW
ncbi:hypothetical protein LOZ12_006009 [Ophidiomyces ophidiicola]|uniref:Uncharacterized protein n=1 Tax=Ophidiomyces ophidiicola TaxID=1387563 RepID=A0ACB8UP28_9EURO|nr:hypothetical protein LOZ64_004467 [Ophidiomyces ophidiicola]KAI1942827.1 hypothetical protein LOZ62_004527 [Ophidiomyces ophidiicola]KAI1966511.1 hypothetical protein LOZ56_005651 [Ophidiomyces ophidiicola]KAI2000221.1 hypothetical protein LOZ50_006114 [Ophidiomyces ophidiicola]KAI2014771.1 hypothetical protein LOZ46_005385 [Ophidiomyces ophidiicola]